MAGRSSKGSFWLVLLACMLAMPTAVALLPGIVADTPQQAVLAGALLGFAHLLLRPVLRILSAPIGCLTLGLFGMVIDVAMIYGCAYFVEGFAVNNWTHAIMAAVLVNGMCLIAGRR